MTHLAVEWSELNSKQQDELIKIDRQNRVKAKGMTHHLYDSF